MTVFELDIRTLSFTTVLFSALYGVGLLLVAYRNEEYKGVSLFGSSTLMLALGFLLLGCRGAISDWLSIVLANELILLSFVLFNRSLSLFRSSFGYTFHFGLLLAILQPFVFAYYTFAEPSVSSRVVWISLALGLVSGFCALDLLRGKRYDSPVALWMTTLPFMVVSGYFLFRALWAMEETYLREFMSAGTIHQLAFMTMNTLVLTSSFGLLWMISTRLERELREQARVDTLTRVYNRRALAEIAVREHARAIRHGVPLSMIMCDIDHFKKVNDTHGHQVGDFVLANFAAILTGNLRCNDYIIRYGGEEFLVLLPDTDHELARAVAEKLRAAVCAGYLYEAAEVRCTASFGVATFLKDENWENIIPRADAALYEAKARGRNMVICR